jgi:hypothetical protein
MNNSSLVASAANEPAKLKKEVKKFIAPEEKAKQNMAKNLFGGSKTSAVAQKPSPAPIKGP